MIIEDIKLLKQSCKRVEFDEGQEIASQLFEVLTKSKNGIGLAANQIGINKRVCVVNVKTPIALINPEIIEESEEEFTFAEGCLSFPNDKIKTRRKVWVKVKTDNHADILTFSADSEDINDAFECACIQHEIDHLNGITMFDRELKGVTIKRTSPKIGRNDKVTITKGSESKVLKYKKIEPFLEDGWTLSKQ